MNFDVTTLRSLLVHARMPLRRGIGNDSHKTYDHDSRLVCEAAPIDGSIIVAAINALPSLLDALETAQAQVVALRQCIENGRAAHNEERVARDQLARMKDAAEIQRDAAVSLLRKHEYNGAHDRCPECSSPEGFSHDDDCAWQQAIPPFGGISRDDVRK